MRKRVNVKKFAVEVMIQAKKKIKQNLSFSRKESHKTINITGLLIICP